MKNYYIEESGQYTIKINIDAESKDEALEKLDDILSDELPIYLNLESTDTEVEDWD